MPSLCILLALFVTAAPPARGGEPWPDALGADLRATDQLPDSQRLRAIELIAARGGAGVAPLLVPLLRDPDAGVRLFVARWLAARGEGPAIEAAAGWVLTPAVPMVDRPFGLEVLRLARALSPRGREAVERALRDPEPAIRVQALDVLEAQGLGPSLAALLPALDDDNREVRLRAIRLAGGSGDPRAAVPLLARLDDADRQLRLEARRALGRQPRAASALIRAAGETAPADTNAFGPTGSDDLRGAAVDALGAMRVPAAMPALAALAERRPADDLARHAQLALGTLGTPAAIERLVDLSRRPPVSEDTTAALRTVGPAAVPALIAEVERGPPTSAAIVAALLADIQTTAPMGPADHRATAVLVAAIESRPDLAPVLVDALARLVPRSTDGAALAALGRAAESGDVETRRRAFAGLLAAADARASAFVDRGLGDGDGAVRELAARLAEATGASGSTATLAAALADPERGVRVAAARALAAIGVPSPVGVAALLGAAARTDTKRDDAEWLALGDAAERLAGPPDIARVSTALAAAAGPDQAGARTVAARALAALAARQPLAEHATVERLLAMLGDGSAAALAAADALAHARWSNDTVASLHRAFAEAETAVQARLCAAIAGTDGGGRWLAALVAAESQPIELRAAAAWAARGNDDAQPALRALAQRTADEDTRPLVENARAARAADRRQAWGATSARLVDTAGTPIAGRWVSLGTPTGGAIWTRSDPTGGVRVDGLGGAAVTLQTDASDDRLALRAP
jgi:HEAT repeat protein